MSAERLPTWFQQVFPLVALFGIIDTIYLINLSNNPSVCTVNETALWLPIDCGSIIRSEYSEILGIPLAYLGFAYYLLIVLVFLFREDISARGIQYEMILTVVIGFGLLFSMYLVYLQLFVIKAICLYCMGSALTTTVLACLHTFSLVKLK